MLLTASSPCRRCHAGSVPRPRAGLQTPSSSAPLSLPSSLLHVTVVPEKRPSSPGKPQLVEGLSIQAYLMLKSIVMNSKGDTPQDMMTAAMFCQPENVHLQNKDLSYDLERHPGSTWRAYSARRHLLRACQKAHPPNEQIHMFEEDADPQKWGPVITSTRKVEDLARTQSFSHEDKRSRKASDGSATAEDSFVRKMYRCRVDSCAQQFETRQDADEHYYEVHKINYCTCDRKDNERHHPDCDFWKKRLRCPLHRCEYRCETEKQLETHFTKAHADAPQLDFKILAKCIANRLLVQAAFACPVKTCAFITQEQAGKLDDHLSREHADLQLQRILRKNEDRPPKPKADAQAVEAQKAEQGRAAAARANKNGWTNERLGKLKPDTLVWARFRNYPFWPGQIDENRMRNEDRIITVYFFGDDTCEKITKFDDNLKLFRCAEFEQNVEDGKQYCENRYKPGWFEDAVATAVDVEQKMRIVRQADNMSKGEYDTNELVGPTVSRLSLRQLGRRAGLLKKHEDANFWSKHRLRQLKSGSLVWYKFPTYPFWPCKVSDITHGKDLESTEISILSFGDGACETVSDANTILRPFRHPKFEAFQRAGSQDKRIGDSFRRAFHEALAHEQRVDPTAAQQSRPMSPLKPPPQQELGSLGPPLAEGKAAAASKPGSGNGKGAKRKNNILAALEFSAPGKKNETSNTELSAREKRMLERKWEQIMASTAPTSAKQKAEGTLQSPAPKKARTNSFSKREPVRAAFKIDFKRLLANHELSDNFDLFEGPKAESATNAASSGEAAGQGHALGQGQGGAMGGAARAVGAGHMDSRRRKSFTPSKKVCWSGSAALRVCHNMCRTVFWCFLGFLYFLAGPKFAPSAIRA